MARDKLTRQQINDLENAAYEAGTVDGFKFAIQRLEGAEPSIMVSEALQGSYVSLSSAEAFLDRDRQKDLPAVPYRGEWPPNR